MADSWTLNNCPAAGVPSTDLSLLAIHKESEPLPAPDYAAWLSYSDGWLSDHAELPRNRGRRTEQCLHIEPSPYDRLSIYGGSLATGSTPPRPLKQPAETVEVEDLSASHALEQLAQMRRIAHLRALVQRPVLDMDVTDTVRQRAILCMLQFIANQKTLAGIELDFKLLAAVSEPTHEEQRSAVQDASDLAPRGSAGQERFGNHQQGDLKSVHAQCVKLQDFRRLLEAHADPCFRDIDGNNCFHFICTEDHARLLLQIAPQGAAALNWSRKSPLETLLARIRHDNFSDFSAALLMYRRFLGRTPFYIRSQVDGTTPCGHLTSTQRANLDLGISWAAVESALCGNAQSLLRSIRSLWLHVLPQPANAADGALYFLLFEEPRSAPAEQLHRLKRVWGALRPLLHASCGHSSELSTQTQEEGCSQLARWLFSVSKGVDGNDQEDPRASYRQDFTLCMAELLISMKSALSAQYRELVSGVEQPRDQEVTASPVRMAGNWLCNSLPRDCMLPRVIRAPADGSPMVLRNNLRVAGATRATTTTRVSTPKAYPHKGPLFELAPASAWLKKRDVKAAFEDLQSLGSHINTSRLLESVARVAHQGDDLVAIACAWLHALQMRRLHEVVQLEVHAVLKRVLDGPGLVKMDLPNSPRPLDDIWNDSQQHLFRSGDMEEAPADFVCDISHASAIFDTAFDLRRCYNRFTELEWNVDGATLLRTLNRFNGHSLEKPIEYPSVTLWIAVQTSSETSTTCGVVVAKVELHLRAFHEKRDATLLFSECLAGSFELPHLHQGWAHLLESCAELLEAERGGGVSRLEHALERMSVALKAPECQLLVAWSGDGRAPLLGRISAAETRLQVLRAEERIFRDSQDRLDTRYCHLPVDVASIQKGELNVMGQAIGDLAQVRTYELQKTLAHLNSGHQ